MNAYRYLAAGIAIALFVAACGNNDGLLGQTAAVTDVFETNIDPCRWEVGLQPPEKWPVKTGSRFRIEKRRDPRYYINVKWDWNNPLEKADMFVINPMGTALATDYCDAGGAVRNHLYTLGITEIDDSMDSFDPLKLRAFIYFPMRLKAQTPAAMADTFYLILLRVVDEESQCDDEHGAGKTRCLALQRLGVLYRKQATPAEFIKAIEDEIEKILPDDPERLIAFHNGVIHGGL
jgi:hypothetical protein